MKFATEEVGKERSSVAHLSVTVNLKSNIRDFVAVKCVACSFIS